MMNNYAIVFYEKVLLTLLKPKATEDNYLIEIKNSNINLYTSL